MAKSGISTLALAAVMTLGLAACEGNPFGQSGQAGNAGENGRNGDRTSVTLVEHDVEAPEVFQENDRGLWDGRPSLGGVWVAHPDVTDPERVIIRNSENGEFVIGALFRREREHPGPLFQVSSDAAATLGMLAGQPAQLNVTALRRQEVPEASPEEPEAPQVADAADEPVQTQSLNDVAAIADAAIASGETRTATAPSSAPAASPGDAPRQAYIQIGIFSVESNANSAATQMRQAGMTADVRRESSQGATFWRVVVGPATSTADRDRLLAGARDAGFTDAYAVSR